MHAVIPSLYFGVGPHTNKDASILSPQKAEIQNLSSHATYLVEKVTELIYRTYLLFFQCSFSVHPYDL